MTELLTELRRRDISLWRDGENLRFSAPAGALTPELRAEVAAHKAELLAELNDDADSHIPRTDRSHGAPLSFSQERLWIVDQITPGLANYNITLCWRIRGALDVAALESSLGSIAERHEILRSCIVRDADGNASQIATAQPPLTLPIVDGRPADLEEFTAREAERPFDLSIAPLWRAVLVRFAGEDHALVLTWHHLILDAWSISLFAKELATHYAAHRAGSHAELPDLPIQFGDFARWQRDSYAAGAAQKHLPYWQARLQGDQAPIALPVDRPRPMQQTFRGGERTRQLPTELASGLRQFARQEGATAFMLFLAAFKALLARYTGDRDICVGSPIAQRSHVEAESLIGFFLNMLALRTDLSGDPSFRELLKRVRSTVLDGFEHQDVPFEKVVEALQPARVLGHHPIFQTAFVLQPGGDEPPGLPGLTIESVPFPVRTSKFDLTLFVLETPAGIRAKIEYNSDIFEPATIDRLLESFDSLLRSALANADTPLSRLPILSDAEREKVLVSWNNTDRAYPHDITVAALFEQRVAKSPDATALIDGTERWTYAKLNAQANAVAHELQSRGVNAGSLIGLPAERSARFIAGIVGILKAGGAYVPLDSTEPPDRLAAMRAQCACVLDFSEMRSDASDENPKCPASPTGPAYVLFTSGSTGAPKGVVVPHRAINRLVINNDYAPFAESDMVAFASNVCFDAATFEIWGALLNGGTLVVTPRDVLLSPIALAAHLAGEHITVLFLTTSLFNRLANESPEMFSSLRHLVFGGEAADAGSVRAVLERGRPGRLVNGYGPTEATTFAVCHHIERVDGDVVPIGKPIANTTAYILDGAMQPVPIGVKGELYLGGPGLAIGYQAAPELTAQRFLETAYGRLYKTGDLARWRADGVIEYLGRADSQIKLRGFRIEPGEIESAIQRHPTVSKAAVIVRQTGDDRALVAYVVPRNGATICEADLRELSRKHLPAPMIPSAFVRLPALPLTQNGKLDYHALPEPRASRPAATEFVGPQNAVQTQLAAIWEEVLNRRPISIHDDFFELGGHSLLAARIISLISERMGKRIGFGEFIENPTIEKHASQLFAQQPATPQPPYTMLHPSGRKTPFFFFHGDVLGGGLFSKTLAGELGSDRPFYAIHPHGLQGDDIPNSVEAMAAERLKWIRKAQPNGPYILGGYCNGSLVAYHTARLLRDAGEQVSALLLLHADGSNIRFGLVKRVCAVSSALRGEDEAAQRRRFLRIRDAISDQEAMGRYYLLAWRDLMTQTAAVKVSRLWRKTRRILRHFLPKSLRSAPVPRTTSRRAPRKRDAIMNVYDDVCRTYFPGHFDSPVFLFWPKEEQASLAGGPARGWAKLCDQVEVVEVPGDHDTCVAQNSNVVMIGRAMRARIDVVENRHTAKST